MKLHRYWILFEISDEMPHYWHLRVGCGVTAHNVSNALQIVQDELFKEEALPPILDVVEDVDVSALDPNHDIPMGCPACYGIWYPRGYQFRGG